MLSLNYWEKWVLSVFNVHKQTHSDQLAEKEDTYENFRDEESPWVYVDYGVLIGDGMHFQEPEEQEARDESRFE